MRKSLLVLVALLCIIAVEAAFVTPLAIRQYKWMNGGALDDEVQLNDGLSNQSYLATEFGSRMNSLVSLVSDAHTQWQAESSTEIAAYAQAQLQTEEARLQEALDRAERQNQFIQEQLELQSVIDELQQEVDKRAQEALESGEIDSVGLPGIQDSKNPVNGDVSPDIFESDVEKPNNGSHSNSSKGSDNEESSESESGEEDALRDEEMGEGSEEEKPITSAHTAPPRDTNALGDVGDPDSTGTVPSYSDVSKMIGEFNVEFVCTCANCFDPETYPMSKLATSFCLADPEFLTTGVFVKFGADAEVVYEVHDGTGYCTGRGIIVFDPRHVDGGGVQHYSPILYLN